MRLSKSFKKSLERKRITYRDLENWKAFYSLKASRTRLSLFQSEKEQKKLININSEEVFKKWAGFSNRTEGTIEEILNWGINPHFILWTVLRVELLPPKYLHELGLFFCRNFHERLAEEGVYIDYRYNTILQVKEDWANGKLSLGNLTYQQRRCSQILVDVHEAKDEKMIAAAASLHAILDEDPRISILNLFRIINKSYSRKKENIYRLQTIKSHIL